MYYYDFPDNIHNIHMVEQVMLVMHKSLQFPRFPLKESLAKFSLYIWTVFVFPYIYFQVSRSGLYFEVRALYNRTAITQAYTYWLYLPHTFYDTH